MNYLKYLRAYTFNSAYNNMNRMNEVMDADCVRFNCGGNS